MPTRAQQLEAVQRLVRESVATVDAIAPDAVRSLIPVLRQVRDELRRDLQDWLGNAPDGSERYTAYQNQQALRSIESAIDRVAELRPAMGRALAKGRHETGPLAVSNLDTEIQRLSSIFGGGMPHVPAIDTAAIIAKGDRLMWKRHETSAARYAGAVGEDIRHLFSVGVAKGETIEQMVNRLRKTGNPRARSGPIDPGAAAGEIADGLFRRHRWWGERLVRTEVMHAYNVQHDEAIDYANENRPEGEDEFLRRWDSSADPRTCPICMGLDGTVTTIGGAFKGGITSPPAHACCRCVTLAWLRRWGTMRGETPVKGELPPPEATARRGGQAERSRASRLVRIIEERSGRGSLRSIVTPD